MDNLQEYLQVRDGIRLLHTAGGPHSKYTPEEVFHYLLLPMESGKARFYNKEDGTPHAFATWCFLTPEKAELFLQDKYTPQQEDWVIDEPSEDLQLWVIDFVAPLGNVRQIVRDLRNTHKELYGTTNNTVYFRRFYDRHKEHKRTI